MDVTLSGVGVLDKAVHILDALEREPLALAGLAAATGMPRPTVHRLACALEIHGLVRRDGDGRFALGHRLTSLGRVAAGGFDLVEAARPALEELRDETGESVQLYVRDGDERVCVLSLESPHGLRTIVPLGARLPLDRGSAGKALTGRVTSEGWAQSVEEREPGVASVSAAVTDGAGTVLAAVSVSGPVGRTGRAPGRRFGAAVAAVADRVARSLTQREESTPSVPNS